MSEQSSETRILKELIGAILGIVAVAGFGISIFATGGPNALSPGIFGMDHFTSNPTGWMGVLPYGVMLLGVAAYLLLRDAL